MWPGKLRKWPWFLANVAVNACQHLATLERKTRVVLLWPLAHTATERPVLFVNSTGYILRKQSVIKNIPVFKVIT